MSDEIKILAVDDDEVTLMVLRKILEAEHYVADTAISATEAFDKLRKNRYDAVMCDIWMPGLDGKAFYEAIKRDFPSVRRKIVFMTADLVSEATWDFIDGQGLPYVLKPFDRALIVQRLTKVIGRRPAVPPAPTAKAWNGDNRRNRRRIPLKSKVKIEPKRPLANTHIGTMIDASIKGACFLCDRQYEIGNEVQFSYPYPDDNALPQRGIVVSAKKQENGVWRIAVKI